MWDMQAGCFEHAKATAAEGSLEARSWSKGATSTARLIEYRGLVCQNYLYGMAICDGKLPKLRGNEC